MRTRENVKQAYIDLLLSDAVRGQQDESVKAFRRHLEQAQGFYDAGSRARFDVTKALVDLGNAELALVEAESEIDTAKATLLNTLGVTDMDTDFDVAMPSWDISADSGFSDLALQNRADYRAAELRTLSGQSTLKAEARYASPTVTLRGGWNETGSQINNLDAGWNTALSLSVPIVDGGVARARVDVAGAQIQSLLSAQETLRQNIILETRKAELAVKNARAGMRITELTVLQAEENYELAEGRYETGVGSPLELTDALLSLTDARLASYRARYNFNNALINLERATGTEITVAR
ncbi:hypothetical protein AGMMS50276_33340 [Synergistales bacterium]|nr:hypothetical protein AGMMS50276_33340 [Synergistales bacterium]